MRLYDGVEHRYSSDDMRPENAIGEISNLLGYRPSPEELAYSLSFYAGRIGVDDRLAVRCRYEESFWPDVVQHLRLIALDQAESDELSFEGLRWLFELEDAPAPLGLHALQFINSHKHTFQDTATDTTQVFFTRESDVNSWCVVWRSERSLNYLSFDQG